MKKALQWLDENLEEVLLVIALAAMAVIMGIQVIARYIFGASLSWSEELTRYIFIWAGFLSVSYCTKKCISIKIEQFVAMFPKRGNGQTSPAMGIPMYYVQAAPLMGFILSAIRVFQRWIIEWKRVFRKGGE